MKTGKYLIALALTLLAAPAYASDTAEAALDTAELVSKYTEGLRKAYSQSIARAKAYEEEGDLEAASPAHHNRQDSQRDSQGARRAYPIKFGSVESAVSSVRSGMLVEPHAREMESRRDGTSVSRHAIPTSMLIRRVKK